MTDSARGIQSVEVSGRVLRALVKFGQPMMLKDLAELADLKPAQAHAYLTSLKNIGLVRQDCANGLYSAGSFALRLGVSWINSYAPSAFAIRQLKDLAERYRVRSVITFWGQFGPTIAHTYAGQTQSSINLRQGSVFSVTASATGRVFMAFGDNEAIEELAREENKQQEVRNKLGAPVSGSELEPRIELIRSRGYETADGQPIPGVNAISVPIFRADGTLDFVATVIGAAEQLSLEDHSDVLEEMCAIAKGASASSKNQMDIK